MKKFLLNVLIFIFCSTIVYIVSLFLWMQFASSPFKSNIKYPLGSYGHLNTRLLDVKKYKDVDILFLGSSHAYRGFDTRIFSKNGYNSFNLGSSAQTPIQTKVFLERYFSELNPKIVIYEVYPTTFIIDGVESSLDIIANSENDRYSLKMALQINNIKTFNSFLYGLCRNWLDLDRSYVEPLKKKKDTYISGGFVEREIEYYKPVIQDNKKIVPNDYQLAAFAEIVELLKSRNVDLILVFAPITEVNYNSFLDLAQFDSLMHTYSEYYNFNKLISLNDTLDFYDAHHLNQNGVKVFNNKLIELLKNRKKK